jgi:hypothetical protein
MVTSAADNGRTLNDSATKARQNSRFIFQLRIYNFYSTIPRLRARPAERKRIG